MMIGSLSRDSPKSDQPTKKQGQVNDPAFDISNYELAILFSICH